MTHDGVPKSKVLLSDCSEMVSTLLVGDIAKTLQTYDKDIVYVHFTDQFSVDPRQYVIVLLSLAKY